MTKVSTKRAFLLTALALLLCISMLVGATFAWFTDSVTSGKNTLTAGNLDVEFEYSTDMVTWKPVKDDAAIFDPDVLWEPGYTEVVYLRVSNRGSLSLKYEIGVGVTDEVAGTNVDGGAFKLSDYILFGVADGVTEAFASRDAAITAVASVKNPLRVSYSKQSAILAGGASEIRALVVYMPSSLQNEVNYQAGTVAPSVSLGLTVNATQYTAESNLHD